MSRDNEKKKKKKKKKEETWGKPTYLAPRFKYANVAFTR